MSDLSIEKQENNISFRFDYTSCWSCVHKHCTRIWCTFGGCVWGVPWLTVWLWPYFHHALACVCTGVFCHCQLDEALHCTTVCSWFTPLFFNNFWRKIKWRVWLIRRGLVGVQYMKVLKEYIFVYSFPSLLLLGFIFSSLNSLNLEVRPEIKVITKLWHSFWYFVWKSSVLNSNSNGNIFGLLYLSYLYFEWVKIASLCQCFCGFIFLLCAAKNSACHLGISRLLLCRFRGHDMTNKEYALRRGVQWTFSIHSAYLLKNQSQNKKLSGSVWIVIIWYCRISKSFGSLYPLVQEAQM